MAPALLAPGPLLVVFAHLALDGLDRFQLLDRVMVPAGDDASLVEFVRLVAPNEVLFRQRLICAEPAFAPIDYASLPFRRPDGLRLGRRRAELDGHDRERSSEESNQHHWLISLNHGADGANGEDIRQQR